MEKRFFVQVGVEAVNGISPTQAAEKETRRKKGALWEEHPKHSLFQLSTAFPPQFFSKREALASRSLTLDGLPFSSFVVAERIMCRWKVVVCSIKEKRLTSDSSLSFPSGGGVDGRYHSSRIVQYTIRILY
ncbi:hypothetical protein R3W88_028054 [Solanum pinnatisectum]|uniref:Uncharacterized protein n=1 Tax=Solanum pinnatisectum TaxID=50273 RepID=A0AAV9LHU2_9SOLN|nr:hypothetical protein R3W88_028054 [Solanum pinnatisectum]